MRLQGLGFKSMSKLGEYIELSNLVNANEKYQVDDVKGISIKKMFIPTKADMDGVSLRNYMVIKPKFFCYVTVTSRNGEKISLAFNASKETFIVSSSYVSFYVKDEMKLLPEYLFMYFNRPEFDRYSRFNSWGSARETFSFEDLCDIEIDVPPLEKQQQAVDVYLALVENQKKYEKGLDDLKLTCDAYIEELRKEVTPQTIGSHIIQRTLKNKDNKITKVLGISKEGFIEPKQKPSENISNYNLFYKNDFVYSPPRINVGSIGLHENYDVCAASPIYVVFYSKDENTLYSKYLNIWLNRSEFLRSTDFYSIGSVRNNFDFNLMSEVKIPIPDISIQKSIANIYDVYNKRKQINEKLKQYISEICPILIRGSINGEK